LAHFVYNAVVAAASELLGCVWHTHIRSDIVKLSSLSYKDKAIAQYFFLLETFGIDYYVP